LKNKNNRSYNKIEEGELLMNKDHKDRGIKKWNGFFMPESIKMLKDLWQDDNKPPRPHLDETKIEEMERLLSEGMDTKIFFRVLLVGPHAHQANKVNY
jgi:hypothetical protein